MTDNIEPTLSQKNLAYFIAAAILLVNVASNIAAAVTGGWGSTTAIVIDIILVAGLAARQGWARFLTLFRAVIGAFINSIIIWGNLAAQPDSTWQVALVMATQLGLSVSLILLLAGEQKNWQIVLGTLVFIFLVIGPIAFSLVSP